MIKKRISYTLLNCYKRCRRRCYLQYFKEVIPYDKVNHRPFMVGMVADWLFGKWIEKDYPQGWMEYKADDMYNWFESKKNIIYTSSDDRLKLIRKLKKAARLMEDVALANDFPNRRIVTQKKVLHTLDGVEYYGKMDLWFPDEKLIWDLKITETSRYLDLFQLHFFAWLAEQKGDEVKGLAFLSPMMKKSLREHDWCDADRVELERAVFGLVEQIKESHWEITAKDCWGCPVAYYCEEEFPLSAERKTVNGGFSIDL